VMIEPRLRHDYSQQAQRYDSSRGVSSAVLAAVTTGLRQAPGRALLDVGGGTGNYASALRSQGWAPTVLDSSREMRRVALKKGLPVVAGEATSLPFSDASFDAVTMISMLHQVEEWRRALAEARRVLKPSGCLAVATLTSDHVRKVAWAFDLFPSMRTLSLRHRPSIQELCDEAAGSDVIPFWLDDLADASIGALCNFPDAILDPSQRRQTSFFERLERDHVEELDAGLRTLNSWLAAGRHPEAERAAARRELGDGCVIAWQRPV